MAGQIPENLGYTREHEWVDIHRRRSGRASASPTTRRMRSATSCS